MTDDEMRVAIAEWVGWREAFPSTGGPHPRTKEGGILLPYRWINEATGKRLLELPDYPNDLNAVHEVETKLEHNQRSQYHERLEWLISEKGGSKRNRARRCISATARQRCEALLKTLGLWRDSASAKEAK